MMNVVTTSITRTRTPEPGPLTKEIAGIIKGRMARYNVSQSEMAAQVGVDQSQLSKMIRGLRAINLDQLEIMCHVLGVEVHDVVEEADVTVTNLGLWPKVDLLVEEGVRVYKND